MKIDVKSKPGKRSAIGKKSGPNWALIQPFSQSLFALQDVINQVEQLGITAWDFECNAEDSRFRPSGNDAYLHLHYATVELNQARKAVSAAQAHLRRITAII